LASTMDALSRVSKELTWSLGGGWLWAHNRRFDDESSYGTSEDERGKNGKWLVFIQRKHAINALIKFYGPALGQRKLGGLMKIPQEALHEGWKKTVPIIIYTRNYEDLEDVGRVLRSLRVLCYVTRPIYYKTDQDTLQGIYASNNDVASIYTANKAVEDAATSSFSSDIVSSRMPGKGDVLHTIHWTQIERDAAIASNGGIVAADD